MDLPSEESLRWIVSRYAGLIARHGEGIGTPELVQPTGEFFPDDFAPTGEAVARLLGRVLEYVPVREGLDVRLRFLEADDQESSGGGCGTGGCGPKGGSCGTGASAGPKDRVLELGDGYLLELPAASVGNAVSLTTALARAAGSMVLSEAGEEVSADELGGMSELTAVACGLGVLLTNGAHLYSKSCGGARVTQLTHLTVEETAVALALFVALHDMKPGAAKAHMETTQREAFSGALDWVTSNPSLVAQMKTRPEMLEAGMFRVEETKGFFGKLFARRAAAAESDALWFAGAPRRTER